jgi:hypothetical protein
MSASNRIIRVDSSNTQVQSLIETIAGILINNGARINPNLFILESDGNLSIHCPSDSTEVTLFVVPEALLIPVSKITWGVAKDAHTGIRTIDIASAVDLTPVQSELLHLQIELYNTLSKFEWFLTEHPSSALSQFPGIEHLIIQCEPNYARSQSLEDFLATRVLGYRDKSSTEEHWPKTPVLMPLVELINHHSRGAPFDMSNGCVTVSANRTDSSSECFVNYGGMRDALQMFVSYGFADESSIVATSTPVTIPLIGDNSSTRLGTLVVERKLSKGYLPKITAHESTLTLSKVIFSPRNSDNFRGAFTLPVKSFAMQQGASAELADRVADRASRELIDQNQQRLGELLMSVVSLGSKRAVLRELESALRIQLRNVDNFSQ